MELKLVLDYLKEADSKPNHRYYSWEHCFEYFQNAYKDGTLDSSEQSCIQLGFYLASWGMYRGSSFLLQTNSLVHKKAIDVLLDPKYEPLWNTDFGLESRFDLIQIAVDLQGELYKAYRRYSEEVFGAQNNHQPINTLITKVILGTIGSLPAYDRYFVSGIKLDGRGLGVPNNKSIERLLKICSSTPGLLEIQKQISESRKMNYPLMKILDMYYWQRGFNRTGPKDTV